MIHTPGILRYFQSYYRTSPTKAAKGFSETYGLPLPVTKKLLSGKLPCKVDEEAGTVCLSFSV
jgi:hypothetical protein